MQFRADLTSKLTTDPYSSRPDPCQGNSRIPGALIWSPSAQQGPACAATQSAYPSPTRSRSLAINPSKCVVGQGIQNVQQLVSRDTDRSGPAAQVDPGPSPSFR
jgi:hypothetical protein